MYPNDDKRPPTYNESMGNPTQPQPYNFQTGYSYQTPYAQQQASQTYYTNQPYPQPQVIVQPGPQVVVMGGNCPNCRVGVLTEDYGCFAIFLAIFFFPIGILCCLAMRERVCTNCRSRF